MTRKGNALERRPGCEYLWLTGHHRRHHAPFVALPLFPTALELAANATRPQVLDCSDEKERVKSYTEESASDIGWR